MTGTIRQVTPAVLEIHVTLQRLAEIHGVLDDLIAALSARRFSAREIFGVRLAVDEALVNAVEHGHRGDPHKMVRIVYWVRPEHILILVEDEGMGFDSAGIADPRDAENLDRPRGRGLLLMKKYMTWIRHNERGNRVAMCKRRAEPADLGMRLRQFQAL